MAFLRKRGDIWYLYWRQNGKQKARSLGTKQKAVAKEYMHEFEHQRAKRKLGQQTDISIDKLLEEYLNHAKATKTENTYHSHDKPRTKRFCNYLTERGISRASEITQKLAEDYQMSLLEEDLSPNTVRHCMFAASGLLTFAVNRQYIAINVIKNVSKVKAPENPPRYLSHEEWETVRQIARETDLWPLVATAYYTGFRNSELRHLTWPEVNFDRGIITLHNKENFTLKNHQCRSVPLNEILRDILQKEADNQGYCFHDKWGRQYSKDRLCRQFRRQIVEPSELEHFSLHTLRHTFASHLVMKGVSIYKVSRWLGHRSVNTTMRYAHLAPQDDEINELA